MTMAEMVVSNGQQGASALAQAGQHETSVVAAAAQAKALVEARCVMAVHRPRDMEAVRVKLLKECSRPGFAESARYSKPVGGKAIEGPSIRFAEAVIRTMGNLDITTPVIFEDDQKRIVRVIVHDLESNSAYSADITVNKTVERRELKKGQIALAARTNSHGQSVYVVQASEDELGTKTAALVSKSLRTSALRLLPGDILEECMRRVFDVLRTEGAKDPDAHRRKLIDAFAALGVQPADLRAYVGRDLGALTPADIAELRPVYEALRDGEATWAAILEARSTTESEAVDAQKLAQSGGRSSKVKEALRQRTGRLEPAPQAAQPAPDPDPSTGEVPADREESPPTRSSRDEME